MKVELIVPCYNESAVLQMFYDEAVKVVDSIEGYDFGFIFINDGSKDNTLDIMKSLAEKDERIKYISFSRNFGKESAMYAGLKNSSGDYAVLLDADLQHPPALIPKCLRQWKRVMTAVPPTEHLVTGTHLLGLGLQGNSTS